MRHIEMHLLENSKDVQSAKNVGLEVGDEEFCEECSRTVGEVNGAFVAFVFILDEDAEWVVCAECASPVL